MDGIIVIDKEKGYTSRDVVNIVSKVYHTKKVGHTGTLDPLATGVLIVCINKATKLVELLTSEDKIYIAEFEFGTLTDTLDIEGNVLKSEDIMISKEDMLDALNKMKGEYDQTVPIYSAIKVNGKKLYEYARNNKKVELPKKEVTIKEIEILDRNKDTFTIKILVSKGTYIRSLINDIGNSLNTYATMTSLIRTKQGKVTINEAYKLNDIKNNNFKYYKIEEVLEYPIIKVDNEIEFKISNGVKLLDIYDIEDKVIFINNKNKLLGIYEKVSEDLKVWKIF